MIQRSYYVYIMANNAGTSYIGVTNDLERRVREHKEGNIKGFTSRYKLHQLVYYEEYDSIEDAISREKQIKKWGRVKKRSLIRELNPTWIDLAADWFEAE